MTQPPAIEARGLRKTFGSVPVAVPVLDGVDLTVPAGSVGALLGPNGAGKTTLVRILTTLLRADGGQALVDGKDVVAQRREVRRSISLTGQSVSVDELQTGRENLVMMGRLCQLSRTAAGRRAGELLEALDLADAGDRTVRTYSGGMRRRLDLAAGLLGSPRVIFLDEPTTGLDPRSRQGLWEIVRELVRAGVSVLLTTQYLAEADQLADRISVLDRGRIVAEGSAAELKARVGGQRLDLVLPTGGLGPALGLLGDRVVHVDEAARVVGINSDGSAPEIRALLDLLDRADIEVERLTIHSASLDDVFMTLTGQTADPNRPAPTDRILEPSHV